MKLPLVLAVAALSAGCSAATTLYPASHLANVASAESKTFDYVGSPQKFTVPSHVYEITMTAKGGGARTGDGGVVSARMSVQPGQLLYVFVGGSGHRNTGGYNGGGYGVNGGGGASDVRLSRNLKNRVIVAGGGAGTGEGFTFENGSSSYYECGGGKGGAAGDSNGESGGSGGCGGGRGGGGGSQAGPGAGGSGGPVGSGTSFSSSSSSGCGGSSGGAGSLGLGGSGATSCGGSGGGGGGGYYGGGGGGSGGCCGTYDGAGAGGGGGAGSSFVSPLAHRIKMKTGDHWRGNGEVIISWDT
jgi:hypothetical protein